MTLAKERSRGLALGRPPKADWSDVWTLATEGRRAALRQGEARGPQTREVAEEARDLHLGSAILSLSALADSGIEHYRGSFHNPGMYLPIATGWLGLAASLFGLGDKRPSRHPTRDLIYAASAAVGVFGLGFHAYNVSKRPGGVSWVNLFYGAPIGAPVALALAGFLGRYAEIVRELREDEKKAAGQELGAVVAAGLAGTVGEAALMHFRGAYHNPAMALPVTLPPLAATLLAAAVVNPSPERRRRASFGLKATAALGFLGVGFHIFGVARNMGGWRNWSQNVLNGPPLPAPPSFTGLALAGLAALKLMDKPK
jgi:hypothetical protein